MKSSKCPNCLLVQWSENDICKRCGTSLEAGTVTAPSYSSQVTVQPTWQQPASVTQYGQPQLKSGLALASMIIAIVSFPTTFLLIGLLLAPVALVMGIVALVRANRKPMEYGGKGFAIAGISVASVVCLFFVPIIAAIAIPNLLASRRAANEGSAFAALQKMAVAQSTYTTTVDKNGCGDLRELAASGLIDAKYTGGLSSGYKFVASGHPSSTDGCEVRATPNSLSEGKRSFYYSSIDNVVRVSMNGGTAGPSDPPMGQSARASN